METTEQRRHERPAIFDSAGHAEKVMGHVYKICLKILQNEHDAQDIYQNIFLKIYDKQGTFSGKSKVSTWVYSIARNTCISFLRERNKLQFIESISDALAETLCITEKEKISSQRLQKKVDECLHRLVPNQKQLLIRRYFYDMSYEDIAEEMGITVDRMKRQLQTARANFKRQFGSLR